jgi:hypothetical protein
MPMHQTLSKGWCHARSRLLLGLIEYVLVDDWWQEHHPASVPNKPGGPALLSDPEVITLAILAQWPRFRSERDFWRFAHAHLRPYFPNLCSQSQLNRRVRSVEPDLRHFQRALARTLCAASEIYHVLDTTLIPAMVRVRAWRKSGSLAGKPPSGGAPPGPSGSTGSQGGTFGQPTGRDLRLRSGGGLLRRATHRRVPHHRGFSRCLPGLPKGFTGIEWERRCSDLYGALVAATPKNNSKRAWAKTDRRWASGKRQIIEGVIDQLKDLFALERHRAKTLEGLLARLAAKMAAYTFGQQLNDQLGRPLRHLADLLV